MKTKAPVQRTPRAVIYTRVSTEEQTANLSLATQGEKCRAYCVENGFEIVQTFVDGGRSAKTTQRDAFQKMITFCTKRQNLIGYVVVQDLSRFSRNMEDQTKTMTQLTLAGVVVRSVMEDLDESSSGKLMRNIHGAINQFENDRKSEKTVTGMQKAASLGRFPFKAPLGYINISAHVGHNLIPDPKSAPLIRKAFQLAAEGVHKKTEILRIVTRLGLQTSKGLPLTTQTFQKMLHNPLYAGWVFIPTWGLRYRGSFEALIEDELFQRVQDILSGKRLTVSSHERNHPDFPLRVFVTCNRCGKPITGSWSTSRMKKKYAYYRCRSKSCGAVNIKRDLLEAKFISLLEGLTPDKEMIPILSNSIRVAWQHRKGDSEALYAAVQAKLAKAKLRKNQLVDALFDGKINQQTYDEQLVRLDEENGTIMRELREAEVQFVDLDGVLAFAEKIVSRPARLWVESSIDQRQRLQTLFFPSGITFDGQEFGTGATSSFFNVLRVPDGQKELLASPTGFEPVSSP